MLKVTSVRISGFKSFNKVELHLGDLNILIGANGAGKSNFASFFRMLNYMMTHALGRFVGESGGAGDLLFHGSRKTPVMEGEIQIESAAGSNIYTFKLGYAAPDRFIFLDEAYLFSKEGYSLDTAHRISLGSGHSECGLRDVKDQTGSFIFNALQRMRFFQFHDTSQHAHARQLQFLDQNRFLKSDAGNLAPFLYMLKKNHPASYDRIVRTVKRVMPGFEDFRLEPDMLDNRKIMLNWSEKGSEMAFGPYHLSDGSLRMMALTTLLMQPKELMPPLIIIDEPELGLHPSAIKLLAGLVRSASAHVQIILSTQSKRLVDEFPLENLIPVDRSSQAGPLESVFQHLDHASLSEWLDEYSTGDMWEHNLIGGRPS